MDESVFSVSKPPPRIVGTGLISLDAIAESPEDEELKLATGGSCGNVLATLSFLGWAAYPVARMNGDAASKWIHDDLKRWGVRFNFSRLKPHADTPIVLQRNRLNRAGERRHGFSMKCPECGKWLPTYRPVTVDAANSIKKKILNPAVFYMDRVSRGVLEIAEYCRTKGAVVYFEPSGASDPVLFHEALRLAHIVKFADDRLEASEIMKCGDLRANLVVQTLAGRGLRYLNRLEQGARARWRRLDGHDLKVAGDTSGAGDWCSAGILHVLAQRGAECFLESSEKRVKEGLTLGQALAAWNCGFVGARGAMYAGPKRKLIAGVRELGKKGVSDSPGRAGDNRVTISVPYGFCRACAVSETSGIAKS